MKDTMKRVDDYILSFEESEKKLRLSASGTYYCGVDLGTACVVLAVLDENNTPACGFWMYADVVRDGMVVDYINAIRIVKELKAQAEAALQSELTLGAAAIPPGTDALDGGAVKNVVESAGFSLVALSDEPSAAGKVLEIKNGAVVDIGGGTTGISIFKDGKVIHSVDEPTGGRHFSLVLAGAKGISYEEAEVYKRNSNNHQEILPVLKPTVEKVASIIQQSILGFDVDEIYLVGGTSCLSGIETIVQNYLKMPVFKPANPLFVTPLGIAMNCVEAREGNPA